MKATLTARTRRYRWSVLLAGVVAVGLAFTGSEESVQPRAPMPPVPELGPLLWRAHFDEAYGSGYRQPSVLTAEGFPLVASWSVFYEAL
jgi:hypothetical protein